MTAVVFVPVMPDGKPLDLEMVFREALYEEIKLAERGLKMPTQTWKHKVNFKQRRTDNGRDLGIETATTSKRYGYNDEGTDPHPILPRNAKALRFYRSGFMPKTRPGRLISSPGKKANRDLTFSKGVMHPGTTPRGFTHIVVQNGDKRLALRVERGIRNELRKWGNG